ncbi:unnamed protein product, partial [Didymodactylos carnosus]
EYFIKAYTSCDTGFYKHINKHLAQYLDYDTNTKDETNYQLINCLIYIVTLVINNPDYAKYCFNNGVCYRGLPMTSDQLNKYKIDLEILNRTFLSTSKDRTVADRFSGKDEATDSQLSVLFQYNITNSIVALDVEKLSTNSDEQEVLITPYALFKINDIKQHSDSNSVEIILEETKEPNQNSRKQEYR